MLRCVKNGCYSQTSKDGLMRIMLMGVKLIKICYQKMRKYIRLTPVYFYQARLILL